VVVHLDIRGNQLRWALITAAALLSLGACDSPASDPGAEDPDLDQMLVGLITHDGQRGLRTFIQPASDDLGAIPQDPRNALSTEKVHLGQLLFHETGLGTRAARPEGLGTWGCVTCHHAGAGFQAGRAQSIGDGGSGWGVSGEGRTAGYSRDLVDAPPLRSPSVLNGAYRDVMLWDGSLGALGQNEGTEAHWGEVNRLGYDGLETQAISALTDHRMSNLAGSVLETNQAYRTLWQTVYPGEEVNAERVGLAIAAYERTLFASASPFQRWLKGEQQAMTDRQKRGAMVFFGDTGCETCHTGPALAGPGFYGLGMPDMAGPDIIGSVPLARGRGGFLSDPSQDRHFKIPQLYNLRDSPFYGHGAAFSSVKEVVEYYNEGVPAVAMDPALIEKRFKPLELTAGQIDDLVVFLEAALRDPDLDRYVPAELPSGNCFPANDPQARRDLGCD
jgi:cytochrome c peroxidase